MLGWFRFVVSKFFVSNNCKKFKCNSSISINDHGLVQIPSNDMFATMVSKLLRPTVRKRCSSDQEKLLKFEAEG